MAWFAEKTGYELIEGDPHELFGFSEFSTDHVLRNLGTYAIYASQLAQLALFRKPI
jgi:hypothetical protein